MMDYNVPLGKLNRGMAVLDVVESLAGSKGGAALTAEHVFRAAALGWCIEFLQVRACLLLLLQVISLQSGGWQ
jgi:farnesyl diphosphate synthase